MANFDWLKSRPGETSEICMPDDWNDHEGWERFYTAMYAKMGKTDWISDQAEMIPIFGNKPARFAADLKAKQWLKVWIPGCGMSPTPKLLAELGLEVHATDVSQTAITFQQGRYKEGPPLNTSINSEQQPGCFECKVHDVRLPYLENYFDLVINVKAFSGFNREAMTQVADAHYRALKPSRQAHFVTLNVKDEAMDAIEDCLSEAGFLVHLSNRWLRRKLREIGIPDTATMFQRIRQNDKNVISILNEHEMRARAEQETEDQRMRSGERVAQISQLTG